MRFMAVGSIGFLAVWLALAGAAYGEDYPAASLRRDLLAAKTWMYQLQGLEEDAAVAALDAADYDMLVLEPGHNFKEYSYDTRKMVERLRFGPNGKRRVLLAYVDVGQAEDYRDYWGKDWKAPGPGRTGRPDFLVAADPDGWSGNYPAAYWRPEWRAIWLGPDGIAARLAGYGFDGLYLDWVEAYDDENVRAAAAKDGVDAEMEMIRFVEELGRAGRRVREGFLVVAQNAPYLIDRDPERYAAAIDALAVEDTWFHGTGDAEWDDPGAGDLERPGHDRSTGALLGQYRKYLARGLPVFSVDYCISKKNTAMAYSEAREAGLRPLVTRVSLSRLTVTPPWNY